MDSRPSLRASRERLRKRHGAGPPHSRPLHCSSSQYSCLWYYGFLRHKIEPAVGALAHGPIGPRPPVKSGQLRDNVVKATFEQACQDVETNVKAGIELCNREYAGRWGVSEPKACRWAKAIVRQGLAEQQWCGQRKVLVKSRRGLRVLNGGA